MSLVNSILSAARAVAHWLLLGSIFSGLIKALLTESLLKRRVGGEGMGGISLAAIIGAPLPLCSCGAIPAALTLYRDSAGRGPTTAFLIGTPGIGVDSLAVSYALLDPFMLTAPYHRCRSPRLLRKAHRMNREAPCAGFCSYNDSCPAECPVHLIGRAGRGLIIGVFNLLIKGPGQDNLQLFNC